MVKTKRQRAAEAAAAQTDPRDNDNNDIPQDNGEDDDEDFEILPSRKRHRPNPGPPEIRFDTSIKNPRRPYAEYAEWKVILMYWFEHSPRLVFDVDDIANFFNIMINRLEGPILLWADNYQKAFGVPNDRNSLTAFVDALDRQVLGDQTQLSILNEYKFRAFIRYNPLRRMDTEPQFNDYHDQFVKLYQNAKERTPDILAMDYRGGFASHLEDHIRLAAALRPSIMNSVQSLREIIQQYFASKDQIPYHARSMSSDRPPQRRRFNTFNRGGTYKNQYSHAQIDYAPNGDGGHSRGGGRTPYRGRGGRGGRVDRGGRGGRGGGRGRGDGYTYIPKSELKCHYCNEKGHFAYVCPKKNVYHVQHPAE